MSDKQRYGRTGASSWGVVDNLTLTRTGNQLTSVSDSGTARLYDPALGRWLSQDPMADKSLIQYGPHGQIPMNCHMLKFRKKLCL